MIGDQKFRRDKILALFIPFLSLGRNAIIAFYHYFAIK
jgi:hypothetical protein